MGQQEEWPWESRKGLLCGIPWSLEYGGEWDAMPEY